MTRSASLGLTAVFAVAIVIVGWWQSQFLTKLMGQTTTRGSREPAANLRPTRVGALGRIEPSSEVLDIDASIGARLSTLFVREGQAVEQGAELAHLDGYDVAVAEKNEIAALLSEARVRKTATDEHQRAMIQIAELKVQTVEIVEPIRIETQRARVRSLEFENELAEKEFHRREKLLTTSAVSQEDHERKKFELKISHESLAIARLTLSELEANFKLAVTSAHAEVLEAKSALDVSLAAIPVASLERKLELAEAKVQLAVIRSPIAGQVLKVLTHAGERIGKDPILKLGNTGEMHAVAEVYETDVDRVRVGQRAEIKSSALSETLKGTVIRVGSMIHKNDVLNVDPAADADARVVEVRIRLDDSKRVAGLTNLQVQVLIDIDDSSQPTTAAPENPS